MDLQLPTPARGEERSLKMLGWEVQIPDVSPHWPLCFPIPTFRTLAKGRPTAQRVPRDPKVQS